MGRIRSGDVAIQGLSELNSSLKAMGPEARAELKAASQEVADMVADDATRNAYTVGGVAAHVAPSIRAAASMAGSAGVGIGGNAFPMAGGAEFGGGRTEKTQQFKPWRGRGEGAGYFLYPAIREDSERIVDTYGAHLDEIIRKRF